MSVGAISACVAHPGSEARCAHVYSGACPVEVPVCLVCRSKASEALSNALWPFYGSVPVSKALASPLLAPAPLPQAVRQHTPRYCRWCRSKASQGRSKGAVDPYYRWCISPRLKLTRVSRPHERSAHMPIARWPVAPGLSEPQALAPGLYESQGPCTLAPRQPLPLSYTHAQAPAYYPYAPAHCALRPCRR